MCGIAGFANFDENFLNNENFLKEILNNMSKSLKRRGNDAKGTYLDSHFGASHARLSIRDLSENGNQPMIKNIDNNKYIIVYNGEIYNTDELKKDLQNKGYKFITTTDTEVILYLFIEYKEKCVNYLNGIFAFSIYDTQNETVYLFRDRVGIKPLFYTIENNTLVFGSEPKTLFEHPNINPNIDLDSLKQILAIGPARVAGKTKWNFIKLFKYAMEGMVAFSTTPLVLSALIGILFCLIAFVAIIVIIVKTLVWSDPVSGWPSLACIIMFLSGLQLFFLGVIGMYLSKAYLEVKQRPLYIIKETEKDK